MLGFAQYSRRHLQGSRKAVDDTEKVGNTAHGTYYQQSETDKKYLIYP